MRGNTQIPVFFPKFFGEKPPPHRQHVKTYSYESLALFEPCQSTDVSHVQPAGPKWLGFFLPSEAVGTVEEATQRRDQRQ